MRKFQPLKSEKIVISIRLEDTKLEQIDTISNKIKISRNELINQCLTYALENIEFSQIKKPSKKDNK